MRNPVLLLLCLTFILTGCQSTHSVSSASGSSVVSSSLSKGGQGCDSDTEALNTLEPPRLYAAMRRCARMHDYQQATFLFALAGSYTWYDAANADTYFARSQHAKLLADAFQAMPADEREQTWSHIKSIMQDKVLHPALCQRVEKTGKPAYTPAYMMKNQTGNRQTAHYSSWPEATRQYLHCDV